MVMDAAGVGAGVGDAVSAEDSAAVGPRILMPGHIPIMAIPIMLLILPRR